MGSGNAKFDEVYEAGGVTKAPKYSVSYYTGMRSTYSPRNKENITCAVCGKKIEHGCFYLMRTLWGKQRIEEVPCSWNVKGFHERTSRKPLIEEFFCADCGDKIVTIESEEFFNVREVFDRTIASNKNTTIPTNDFREQAEIISDRIEAELKTIPEVESEAYNGFRLLTHKLAMEVLTLLEIMGYRYSINASNWGYSVSLHYVNSYKNSTASSKLLGECVVKIMKNRNVRQNLDATCNQIYIDSKNTEKEESNA